MDNFKILIRLLTNQGYRSDIAFDFKAERCVAPLAAAARACIERADTMPTPGGISQLDISICDSECRQIGMVCIRPHGKQAALGHQRMFVEQGEACFNLQPNDVEMFHLAAHALKAESETLRSGSRPL